MKKFNQIILLAQLTEQMEVIVFLSQKLVRKQFNQPRQNLLLKPGYQCNRNHLPGQSSVHPVELNSKMSITFVVAVDQNDELH
jgi:hypothetical protein